jgi:hypothetical protein
VRPQRATFPRGIEDAVGHEWGGLKIGFRTRPEAVGLETPRDLKLAEVASVDLIKRRVVRIAEVRAVGAPIPLRAPDCPDTSRAVTVNEPIAIPTAAASRAENIRRITLPLLGCPWS